MEVTPNRIRLYYLIHTRILYQNVRVDTLTRMYNITEIKNESYSTFLDKFETQLIVNKNNEDKRSNDKSNRFTRLV